MINMVIFAHTHVIHTMVDHSELQYHVYTIQFTGMVTGKYKVPNYKGKYVVSVHRQLYLSRSYCQKYSFTGLTFPMVRGNPSIEEIHAQVFVCSLKPKDVT